MNISKSNIKSLIALANGEKIASSSFSGELLRNLLKEEILDVEVHGRQKRYYVRSGTEFRQYLACNYKELQNLEQYLDMLENPESVTRAKLTSLTGDSKTLKHRTCEGFLVNSYSPVKAALCGRDISINPDEGSYLFVADPESFDISEDTLVIGIENMENFYEIRKQRKLFDQQLSAREQNILFVSRYPQRNSRDLQKWLQRIANRYIHFGDFDPAGIRIYQTEFLKYMSLDRCSFLVPDDIENRLRNGLSDRYNSQISILKGLELEDYRLEPLLNLMKKYHKCCDQEIYIEST